MSDRIEEAYRGSVRVSIQTARDIDPATWAKVVDRARENSSNRALYRKEYISSVEGIVYVTAWQRRGQSVVRITAASFRFETEAA